MLANNLLFSTHSNPNEQIFTKELAAHVTFRSVRKNPYVCVMIYGFVYVDELKCSILSPM